MNKNRSGWKGESRRHSLAKKGIKTIKCSDKRFISNGDFSSKSFITPDGKRIYLEKGETHRTRKENLFEKNYIRKTTLGTVGLPTYEVNILDSKALQNIEDDLLTYPMKILSGIPIEIYEVSKNDVYTVEGEVFVNEGFNMRKALRHPLTKKEKDYVGSNFSDDIPDWG